jgi:hypothetical protein
LDYTWAPKKLVGSSQAQNSQNNNIQSLFNIRQSLDEIIRNDPRDSMFIAGTYKEYAGGAAIASQIQADATQGYTIPNIPQIQGRFAYQVREFPNNKNVILIGTKRSNNYVNYFLSEISPQDAYIPNAGVGKIIGARFRNGKVGILVTGYNETDVIRAAVSLSRYDKFVNGQNHDFNFMIVEVDGLTATDGRLVPIK